MRYVACFDARMRSIVRTAVTLAFLEWSTLGCGGGLPEPESAVQPSNAFIAVAYPPPPAHVESVPPKPTGAAVWIDGQWLWDGRSWIWTSGGWVVPERGERFARWELRREVDGRLSFAPPSWRGRSGEEVVAPTVLSSAGHGGAPLRSGVARPAL